MTALNTWFFHDSIKLYTGVFGSIFNEIKIQRNSKLIKVPIAFTLKQKYDVRNTENPDPNELRKKMTLPRMGFRLIYMRRDTTRAQNKLQVLTENVSRSSVDSVKAQFNRVPYVFGYELVIKTLIHIFDVLWLLLS